MAYTTHPQVAILASITEHNYSLPWAVPSGLLHLLHSQSMVLHGTYPGD